MSIGSCIILISYVGERRMLLSYTHLSVGFPVTDFRKVFALERRDKYSATIWKQAVRKHLFYKKK